MIDSDTVSVLLTRRRDLSPYVRQGAVTVIAGLAKYGRHSDL